ncbi:U1 small nuclear ribonucleoprotein C [Savitreella phatthalungensis]
MPKYYCDYCDKSLTHDSASVRKAHAGGRQHNQFIRDHYQRIADEMAAEEAAKRARAKSVGARAELRPGMPMPFRIGSTCEDANGVVRVPVAGLPLPVPVGVPARPGFPPQTVYSRDMAPRVAPGMPPPSQDDLPPEMQPQEPVSLLSGAAFDMFGKMAPPQGISAEAVAAVIAPARVAVESAGGYSGRDGRDRPRGFDRERDSDQQRARDYPPHHERHHAQPHYGGHQAARGPAASAGYRDGGNRFPRPPQRRY